MDGPQVPGAGQWIARPPALQGGVQQVMVGDRAWTPAAEAQSMPGGGGYGSSGAEKPSVCTHSHQPGMWQHCGTGHRKEVLGSTTHSHGSF